jgi:hypothetical protein
MDGTASDSKQVARPPKWPRVALALGLIGSVGLILVGFASLWFLMLVACFFGSSGSCGPDTALFLFGALAAITGLALVHRSAWRGRRWAVRLVALWGLTVAVTAALVTTFILGTVNLMIPVDLMVLLAVASAVCLTVGASYYERRLRLALVPVVVAGAIAVAPLPAALLSEEGPRTEPGTATAGTLTDPASRWSGPVTCISWRGNIQRIEGFSVPITYPALAAPEDRQDAWVSAVGVSDGTAAYTVGEDGEDFFWSAVRLEGLSADGRTGAAVIGEAGEVVFRWTCSGP